MDIKVESLSFKMAAGARVVSMFQSTIIRLLIQPSIADGVRSLQEITCSIFWILINLDTVCLIFALSPSLRMITPHDYRYCCSSCR